jgi:hypothetical protein
LGREWDIDISAWVRGRRKIAEVLSTDGGKTLGEGKSSQENWTWKL